LGIISLAHTPVHVTDFLVVNVPVDELSSAQIGQHLYSSKKETHSEILGRYRNKQISSKAMFN
jgi:hypothetical protein